MRLNQKGNVNVNLQIDDYTNRVLGVIKAKYGFRDKSQALVYFAKTYGKDYAEPEVKDEYVKEILDIENKHIKKYGLRKQTFSSLRKEIDGSG